jgi:hypothetical protein
MNAFGYLAEFNTPGELLHAAEAVRDAGYTKFDAHSPFPIHGMDDAMGLKPSKLGWVILCGGGTGLLTGITLQWWASTVAYPLVISGKPLFSFQAFVPVTFELMVLFSAFSAVFGMLVINRLPKWYHSLFNHESFGKVTSHGFFISVEAKDPLFDTEKTKQFLENAGGQNVSLVEE